MITFSLIFFIITFGISKVNGLECGDPGRPAYGRAVPKAETYSEGQSVSYACDTGYYMVGPILRRCLPNGTWTGNMPVCDTTLSPVGYASATESLSLYPPELAIDGNKRTCYYSNRRKPRWWRMDLGQRTTVISVSITVPFAMSEQHFTIYLIEINGTVTKYEKCASFKGIFSSQTLILVCTGKGVSGQLLHIEDDFDALDYFGLCEVEVFVQKDVYECGKPETPTNSFYTDRNNVIEYGCNEGYKLEGPQYRWCLKKGQWSGGQAICREVICPRPATIENGFYHIVGKANNKPSMGSKLIVICKTGYNLIGNETLICEENGSWSGRMGICQPVDCGDPPLHESPQLGGKFKLLNGSTKYQSIAELICASGKRPGIKIHCRDDGIWSQLMATCIVENANNLYGSETSHFSVSKSLGNNFPVIITSIIAAVLFLFVICVIILYKKNILQLKWSFQSQNNGNSGPSQRRTPWIIEALRNPILLRCKLPMNAKRKSSDVTTNNSSIKSNSSKFENIYEEIPTPQVSTLSSENAEKIRKAAIIAAEIAAVSRQKRESTERSVISALYAKVDFAQKRRQRLEKKFQFPNQKNGERLRKTVSTPGPIYAFASVSAINDDHHVYPVNPDIKTITNRGNCMTSFKGENNESSSSSFTSVTSFDKEVYGLK